VSDLGGEGVAGVSGASGEAGRAIPHPTAIGVIAAENSIIKINGGRGDARVREERLVHRKGTLRAPGIHL